MKFYVKGKVCQIKTHTLHTAGGGGQKALNNQSLGTKENPKSSKSLDSKSKNPNKIQTTKIQDSKIQLESNPKDLAKLESQKISKS